MALVNAFWKVLALLSDNVSSQGFFVKRSFWTYWSLESFTKNLVVAFIDYDVEALSNVVVNVEPMTTIAPQPTKVDLIELGKLNNVS